jgi:hypothetical protein
MNQPASLTTPTAASCTDWCCLGQGCALEALNLQPYLLPIDDHFLMYGAKNQVSNVQTKKNFVILWYSSLYRCIGYCRLYDSNGCAFYLSCSCLNLLNTPLQLVTYCFFYI